MKWQPIIAGLALAAPLALAGPAMAQSGNTKLSSSDQQFLNKLSMEDQSEINMANLALQKSPNAQVKSYARNLLSADPSMESQARTIAQDDKATISSNPTVKEQHEYTKLSSLSGNQFDQEYLKYEANRQQQDLGMVQQEVKDTKNPQLKSFAEKEEAPVRDASASAHQLATSMGVKVASR